MSTAAFTAISMQFRDEWLAGAGCALHGPTENRLAAFGCPPLNGTFQDTPHEPVTTQWESEAWAPLAGRVLVTYWAEVLLFVAWCAAAAAGRLPPADKVAAASVAVCAAWAAAEQWLMLALVGAALSDGWSPRAEARLAPAVTSLAAAAAVCLGQPVFAVAAGVGAAAAAAEAVPARAPRALRAAAAAAALLPPALAHRWYSVYRAGLTAASGIAWAAASAAAAAAAAAALAAEAAAGVAVVAAALEFRVSFTLGEAVWELACNAAAVGAAAATVFATGKLVARYKPKVHQLLLTLLNILLVFLSMRAFRTVPLAYSFAFIAAHTLQCNPCSDRTRAMWQARGIAAVALAAELLAGSAGLCSAGVVAVVAGSVEARHRRRLRDRRSRLQSGGTVQLFHATNAAAAESIRREGFRCGATGVAGGGIYFGTTAQVAAARSQRGKDVVLVCRVRLGSVRTVGAQDTSIRFRELLRSGHDSVLVTRYGTQVYAVYNPDQVEVIA